MAHLLIAGLPGAGKTYFCRWLRDSRGYLHIETDYAVADDPAVQLLLAPNTGNVTPVADDFKARGPNVALEWGFLPSWLGRVRQLIGAGFEQWWFAGDEEAARRAFLARGDVSEEAFNQQIADIHASWERIDRVFNGRILDVVRSGPGGYAHLSAEEVLRIMDGRHPSPWPSPFGNRLGSFLSRLRGPA